MLTPLHRTRIFHNSPLADNYIAGIQQAYSRGLDGDTYWEAKLLATYDHLEPFQKIERVVNKSVVLAYPAKTKADYINNMPLAFQHFLKTIGIEALYMLEFNQSSLVDFPFENFRKKNAFKRIAKSKNSDIGFEFDISFIPRILPFFLFSNRYNISVLTLLSANNNIPIAFEFCDDGNWHVNYNAGQEEKVVNAAQSAGLEIGDLSLCSKYYLHALS